MGVWFGRQSLGALTMFSIKLSFLYKSTHPMPSFAVALFATLFAVGIGLETQRVAIVGFAVLLQQFSVGLSNDWLDHKRDRAAGRTDKPVARGSVGVSLVRNSSFAAGILALLVSGVLGWESVGWMVLMLIAGWIYNLGLKATAFSVLPYAIGFGILPVFVTLSLEQSQVPPAWVVVVAALLGVSAHFANTLPDLLQDKATGVRALPHLVGQKISALVIATTAILASSIAVYQSNSLAGLVGVIGLTATIVLAGAASLLSLRPTPPRVIFPLLVLASLVNAVLLMLGVGPIGS